MHYRRESVTSSVRYWRERFSAVVQMGRKCDKGVTPGARSTKWAAFITFLICHGEEAEGLFSHSVYRCVTNTCELHSRFIAFHSLSPFTV